MFMNHKNQVDVDELERVNAAMAQHLELLQEFEELGEDNNEEA